MNNYEAKTGVCTCQKIDSIRKLFKWKSAMQQFHLCAISDMRLPVQVKTTNIRLMRYKSHVPHDIKVITVITKEKSFITLSLSCTIANI